MTWAALTLRLRIFPAVVSLDRHGHVVAIFLLSGNALKAIRRRSGDDMRRTTVMAAFLVLLAAVVAADAQGIGYGPGVNPSNPSDLRYRSNPQDLTAPGGSNRQDLVRRPGGVTSPAGVTSVVTSPTRTTARRYKMAKSKPKK